jgi:urease gamma subunit/urease beta subunit
MGPMRLTPWEEERLLIFTAAELARRHRAAGLVLNAPETIALICDAMFEAARAGGSYPEVEAAGRAAVSPDEVMPGVRDLVDIVPLEVLLDDGTRLVVVLDPLGRDGDAPADDGPGAIRPARDIDADDQDADARPPETQRDTLELVVRSESNRAIRVTSHYPFERVNRRLSFDRQAARGFRLDVPAGATVRWAPGEAVEVGLVRYGGRSAAPEGGDVDHMAPSAALRAASRPRLSAEEWLARFGPTTGDRVRLGDTDLWLRVAEDRTARGDEPLWGYGKNLRSRMAQADRATRDSELDILVAGALVVDPAIGIVKADIGIKDGRIVGVGRAGNPDISDGIDLVVGPHTEPIMGYGLIATPGAVDSHVHLISPRLIAPALSAGVTTLITAGFEEPPWAMERTLRSIEAWPVNLGLQAGARADAPGRLERPLAPGRNTPF